ncbi:MAG: hypothetical protein AAGB12_16075 [Pseudomonadota bacterium]
MDKVEHELNKLWSDGSFDEYNLSEIEDILKRNPSYVDFFVRKIDIESSQMDTLYLIVLNAFPLESCIRYAIDKDDWVVEDFSEYDWFEGVGTFKPMSLSDYENWLSQQMIKDGRG